MDNINHLNIYVRSKSDNYCITYCRFIFPNTKVKKKKIYLFIFII